MNKILKRVVSAVTAFAVTATAAFAIGMPEKFITVAAADETTHTNHRVCGKTFCGDEHVDITDWQAISDEDGLKTMTNGGHYYLTQNIDITTEITIKEGAEITLCLNGKTITQTGNKRVFRNGTGGDASHANAVLNICDCSADKSGMLTGGNISNDNGGCVKICGTLNMYGGTISGNSAKNSGGVYIMFGTFNMYDGTIFDNKALNGSGGGVDVGAGAKFNMYGGTISGNTSSGSGGGVYVSSLGATAFKMYGGTISGNTANGNGGGVYATKTTLDGNVIIKDNKAGADSAQTDNNICLQDRATLTIGANFSTDSQIGISTVTALTCKKAVDITTSNNVTADTVNSFKAEIEGQEIVFDKTWKRLQLSVPHNYEGSVWKITKAPTSSKTGTAAFACMVEGCTGKETKTLPKVDFSKSGTASNGWIAEYTLPTLTKAGKIEYKDATTNDVMLTMEIPTLNAVSGDGSTSIWTKAEVGDGANKSKNPTSTAEGTFVYTSTDYGTIKVSVPKLSDDSTWTKSTDADKHNPPTMTEAGFDTYTSADYGKVTVVIPALNDTSVWTKDSAQHVDPTANTPSKDVYTSNDYGTVEVTIPALNAKDGDGNNIWTKDDTQHVDPTEDTDGKDVYKSVYGEVEVILTATGHTHDWGEWETKTNPTTATTGVAERVCKLNPDHKETTVLPKLPALGGGTPEAGVTFTAPTKDGAGTYTYTKTDENGETVTVTIPIPALTDTSVWTNTQHVDPTATTPGKDVYTSEEFGTIEVILPATGTTTPTTPPTTSDPDPDDTTSSDDGNSSDNTSSDTSNGTSGGITAVEIGEGAPSTSVSTPADELYAAILTEDEQKVVNGGAKADIKLKVDAVDEADVDDEIKSAILNMLNEEKPNSIIAKYLNIELTKKVGLRHEEKIMQTNNGTSVELVFDIPEDILGSGEYYIICYLNGKAFILDDTDDDPLTVTVKADKFATYALAHRTAAASDNNSSGGNSGGASKPSDGNPATGAAISLIPIAVLSIAFVVVSRKKK